MAKKSQSKQKERLFEEKLVPAKPGSDRLFDVSYGDDESKAVECMGMKFLNDEARRTYFTGKLRERLREPVFRKIEGFPIGEDEDILALSDPPYYTACPNPFIAQYIDWWRSVNRGSTIAPQVLPFSEDMTSTMRDDVLNLHAYHTKVPPKTLAQLIRHYTRPGDIVLDVFSGSGMTGVALAYCDAKSKGADDNTFGPRMCVQTDLSPLAAHTAGTHIRAVPKDLELVAQQLIDEAEAEHCWLYEHRHKGGGLAPLSFAVWTEFFACPNCSAQLEAFNSQVDFKKKEIRKVIRCNRCAAELKTDRLERIVTTEMDFVLGRPRKMALRKLRWIVLSAPSGRVERPADANDMKPVEEARRRLAHMRVPHTKLPFMHMSHERNDLPSIGYDYVHAFYSERTLFAVSDLRNRIEQAAVSPTHKRWLLYLLTSGLDTHLVLRNRYIIDRHHPSGTTCGPLSGTLYMPVLQCEVNVYRALRKKARKFSRVAELLARDRGVVSTQAASSIEIASKSIDYVFIDPPFGANLNYSDLNFLSESWLGVLTNRKPETVIDTVQEKGLREYGELMTSALSKCFDALKPGRWITILFHNSQNAVWVAIQEALQRAGFVIADVRVLDKGGTTIFQDSTTMAVKKDLLISAYKPTVELEETCKVKSDAEGGVWDFVRLHLRQLPTFLSKNGRVQVITERQSHMLFDRMVAFHVQRGLAVPKSAADFYIGLRNRFPERDGMYFLAEQILDYDGKRLEVREVEQYELFVSDEKSAIQWVRRQLSETPTTYQDLQPVYMKEAQRVWEKYEQPLELRTILEQNFLEDRNGKWRIPDPKKEPDLEHLRHRVLMKEFQQYIDTKGKLKIVRTEALRAGFKDSWQRQDYRTIVQIAKRVPEAVVQEDQALLMYYDNALLRTGE